MTVGFVTAFLTASVRMAVPLIYAGLGETISEKAGILNIGMEGVMLGGAFFSFAGTFYSGSLAVGLLCGMAGPWSAPFTGCCPSGWPRISLSAESPSIYLWPESPVFSIN